MNEDLSTDRLIPTAEVAQVLGRRPRTICRMAREGRLTPVGQGRRLYFRVSEIKAYMDSQRKGDSS